MKKVQILGLALLLAGCDDYRFNQVEGFKCTYNVDKRVMEARKDNGWATRGLLEDNLEYKGLSHVEAKRGVETCIQAYKEDPCWEDF